MANFEIISALDTLDAYIHDLQVQEDERAANYIRLNRGNETVRRERTTMRDSYSAALYQIALKVNEMRRKART